MRGDAARADWHQNDVDPHADPIPSLFYTCWKKNYFYSQQCNFTLFFFFNQLQRCHDFKHFGHNMTIFWKK
jgi:hypothetical protein